jgi:hypothetical protein
MDISPEHRRILLDIRAGREVSEEEANWAVKETLATQGEDGDIDLTQTGRQELQDMTDDG